MPPLIPAEDYGPAVGDAPYSVPRRCHYVGTAGDGGTIAIWMYDSSYLGDGQKFTARLELSIAATR